MGAFDFSLEDLEITVTDNTDGSDAGDDAVAVQDVQEAEEQVENMLNKLNKAGDIINNLMVMADHVKKFKVTAAMLDLHNKGNKLGRAIGMTLPTVESDDEPGDVEGAAADVEVEIVVESIGEKVNGAKQWIIDFFKKIYLTLKDYYTKYLGLAGRLERRLKKIKSTIIGKNIARDAYGDYKANLYPWKDFTDMVDSCIKLLTDDSASMKLSESIDTYTAKQPSASDQTDLNKIGYEIDFDSEKVDGAKGDLGFDRITSFSIIPGGDEPSKEHDTLDKLGWSFATLSNYHGKMLELVKKMKDVAKVEKNVNKAEKAANKSAKEKFKSLEGDAEKKLTVALTNLTKLVRVYIQGVKAANRVAGQLVVMYCSTIEKAKIKN